MYFIRIEPYVVYVYTKKTMFFELKARKLKGGSEEKYGFARIF